jgi:hypothetical protein
MSRLRVILRIVLFVTSALASLSAPAASLVEVKRVALPEVRGRIDHMALDRSSGLLVVAALGNHSLEIVDPRLGRVVRSVPKLDEPQGVAARDGHAVVADGGAHRAIQVNLGTGTLEKSIPLPDDPDNIREDPAAGLFYIGAGSGRQGSLEIFDSGTLTAMGQIALPGHPESFQLEHQGGRVFINVPDVRAVIVADRTSRRAIARWKLPVAANFPMALDEPHKRLFVITRSPATVQVVDTSTGAITQSLNVVGDGDDVFYDAASSKLYVIGGEGFVDVLQDVGGTLRRAERIPTRAGARTGLLMPDRQCLVVAVPRRGTESAELRLFRTSPASSRTSSPCLQTN